MSMRYEPTLPEGLSFEELKKYLDIELSAVSESIARIVDGEAEISYAEPERPTEGMIRYAEGTSWDPGEGDGLYYYKDGTWNPLFDITQTVIESTLVISDGGLTFSAGGAVAGGQTAYDTGNGFYLGWDNSLADYVFSIGQASGEKLTYDGTNLSVTGNITATTISADSGTIGGFTITAATLEAGAGSTHVELSTSEGIFLGADTFASAPFSVNRAGALASSSGQIGGWSIGATTLSTTGVELDAGNNRLRLVNGLHTITLDPTNGFVAYSNSLGFNTVEIPVDGTAPTFSSGIIKEYQIELYTAGIIRTDADVPTNGGVIISPDGIKGYTSAPELIFDLNLNTNTLTMKGALTIQAGSTGVANLSDAGALATRNDYDWNELTDGSGTKPADNATVGADWNTNLTNIPGGIYQVFYQATAPVSGVSTGDYWIDSDDDKLYRYNGLTWDLVQDADIQQALADAANAQSTADGKIITFVQVSAPTASAIGDLWLDSDDDYKLYRWNGSTWEAVPQDYADWQKVFGTGRPADNATVGATWGTDLGSIPARFGDTATSAGLYLTADYMGYWDGAAWDVYIRNNGLFQFNGDGSNYITWNGTTLTVSGAISIVSGSGIGNLSDAGALAEADSADFATQVSGAEKPDPNADVTSAEITAGLTLSSGFIKRGTGEILIDFANRRLTIGSETYHATGIQLEYNGGNPRAHIGNSATYLELISTPGSEALNYVGGTIQTATSGQRVEVLPTGVFQWYDSSNNKRVEIAPSTVGSSTFLQSFTLTDSGGAIYVGGTGTSIGAVALQALNATVNVNLTGTWVVPGTAAVKGIATTAGVDSTYGGIFWGKYQGAHLYATDTTEPDSAALQVQVAGAGHNHILFTTASAVKPTHAPSVPAMVALNGGELYYYNEGGNNDWGMIPTTEGYQGNGSASITTSATYFDEGWYCGHANPVGSSSDLFVQVWDSGGWATVQIITGEDDSETAAWYSSGAGNGDARAYMSTGSITLNYGYWRS